MNRDEIVSYIQDVHFGYLATVGADNAPRVRPIGIYNVYNDDIYFFTFSTTRKVAEMENNPLVEVVWCKLDEQSQVRISGEVAVETDAAMQQRFREDNPMVDKLLPPQAQHLFQLYKLRPATVHIAKGLVPYNQVAW